MPRPVRFSTRKRRSGISPKLRALLGGGGVPKKKPETPEHDAQVTLFDDHLRVRLVPKAVAFAIGNGGKRHKSVAAAMKAEGVTAGIPDIEVIHAARAYFIELKKPRVKGKSSGTVSAEQKVMMARLVEAGAICAVCHGWQEAVEQLEAWGLLRTPRRICRSSQCGSRRFRPRQSTRRHRLGWCWSRLLVWLERHALSIQADDTGTAVDSGARLPKWHHRLRRRQTVSGAYYNEQDPHAADLLDNLIAAGAIPAGVVDRRDVRDVRPADLVGYTQCHFFAGIGGWPATLRRIGWPDDRPAWTGSPPCQGNSRAGLKRGFEDERHLWPVFANLIRECRPPVVLGEQSPDYAPWLKLVHGDLEAMDYAVGGQLIEAACAGAEHRRARFFFVADDNSEQRRIEQQLEGRSPQGPWDESRWSGESIAVGYAASDDEWWHGLGDGAGQIAPGRSSSGDGLEWLVDNKGKARRAPPGIRLLAPGISGKLDRRDADGRTSWYARRPALKGFGNAIDLRPASKFVAACMRVLVPMTGYPLIKAMMKAAEVYYGLNGGGG